MMNFEAVSKIIIDQFNKQQLRVAIIGGFALHAAGFHRATQDIDFLIHHQDVDKLKSILLPLGYDIIHESQDVMNFWGKLDSLGGLDFIIAHRPYALAMIKRSKSYEVLVGYKINVVVPEDIIGLKLQALVNDPDRYAQDMADIEWLIKRYNKKLDLNLLREYFSLFDLTSKLDDFIRRTDLC